LVLLNRYKGKKILENGLALRGIVVVFLLPSILSIIFSSFVLAEVLKNPERELDMLQVQFPQGEITSYESAKIIGLQKEYSTSVPVDIKISIPNDDFDCGDLYITIFDLSISPKEIVTQSGFFDQCFAKNNLTLPVDDEFSEKIDEVGNYEIFVEMNDKDYKKTFTTSETFIVK